MVVLPEYRGYSLLAGEEVNPDAIREDMLGVVNYLNQAMGIDFGDMVLLVAGVSSRARASVLTFRATLLAN